mmetsp:Transcript_19326/g.28171  ORF Transcript_19326/g.28171 Transcript_19326/m.28171 type:complete len:96 (+) Transcript_19326:70-357(+)
MKSFGTTSLFILLALFSCASALRPHSFLIPNTEVMDTHVTKDEVSWNSRRGNKRVETNDHGKEVETVVRILRGSWGMTQTARANAPIKRSRRGGN